MMKSNAWHKRLKIFFHKAKSFTFGIRNALTIFSNVQAEIISHIPIKTITVPNQ